MPGQEINSHEPECKPENDQGISKILTFLKVILIGAIGDNGSNKY